MRGKSFTEANYGIKVKIERGGWRGHTKERLHERANERKILCEQFLP